MVDHDGWWITCRLDFRRWMVDHMQVGVFDDGMVDHMQVGFSTMDGGSHAVGFFDDGWWITCKLDFRRWMVDHMQLDFDDGWWITCKLDFRRWMVDHMQDWERGFPPGLGTGFPPGFLQPPGIGQQFGRFFPAETDFDTDDSEVLLVQDNGIIDNGVGVGNGGVNRLNSGPASAPVQPVIIVQPATAGATAAATTVAAMTTVAVTTTMATTTEVKEP
ncbi:Hypothetical predicted protein [Mytilus galloprovincialis]|uniref:Uncharacterized protein n=1 Tax=Mytilus galloprovincialis TaxID=29158 RepID=A0A8B6GHG0_MYTGA|nr:Hypothetical predicted protein [Mytilus galloprovincialis]